MSLLEEFEKIDTELLAWLFISIWIAIGILIGIIWVAIGDRKMKTYKEGQIDAINGDIKYELVKKPNGEMKWEEIKNN